MINIINNQQLPNNLKPYVNTITYPDLGDALVDIEFELINNDLFLLTFSADLEKDLFIGSWQVDIKPNFTPSFHWTPHLTPNDGDVVDMHVFRTPALMMGDNKRVLSCLPSVGDIVNNDYRYFLDLNAISSKMSLGITTTKLREHIIYQNSNNLILPKGKFTFQIILLLQEENKDIKNPFRKVLSYYWQKYGSQQINILAPYEKLIKYVDRTYEWAFGNWKSQVFQSFELNGVMVGAPQFIVTVHQSPNYNKAHSIRESMSIWNQAWFSSLRSAMGTYRYAKLTNNDDLIKMANMTKELALQFKQDKGLFHSVIAVPDQLVEIDGELIRRPKDWSNYYFGNSDRNPVSRNLQTAPYHILDMSWTALYMLNWYQELDQDQRLLDYTINYAKRLLSLQDSKGYFPAWLDVKTQDILPYLTNSPESAVSATFLIKLYEITNDIRYLNSATRCLDILVTDILPTGRWEDFETYWSCSRYGSSDLVGKKVKRNDIYKQNSLSMFYLAQALMAYYKIKKDHKYLNNGLRCLDELLMLQSSFQPKYMPIPTIGGFGVMNCDGELNDSRQSLFAPLIVEYGVETKNNEYIERGYAALRASFSMMYCPENPEMMQRWQQRWPFLSSNDYGFMMENFAHEGYANSEDFGIGEFTIFDWGNGAASESYLKIDELYKKKLHF